MKEDSQNKISVVYANDTVDFGTLDFKSSSHETLAKKDDLTHIGSDSDTGDDPSNSNSNTSKDFLPQHAHHLDYNYNDNPNNSADLYQEHISYLDTPADATIIDNRKLVYIPVRLNCGICAYCSPDVLKHCPMVLRSIQADIRKAFAVLPVAVHSLLRRTKLWLNYNGYAYGSKANPRILRHITTHHHPSWLIEWACDTPQKATGIEIYSCVDFQTMRLHWNGSGLLLHEFCHLIHQCCLEDGLENKTVEALYEKADASGKYEKVLRRDWAGKTKPEGIPNLSTGEFEDEPDDSDLAYAMVDPKEFFAEFSVAFLCTSYKSLDKQDPNTMEACSPPLLHPDVTKRIEQKIAKRHRKNHPTMTKQNSFYPLLERGISEKEFLPSLPNTEDETVNGNKEEKEGIDCWDFFPPLARFVNNVKGKLGKSEEDADPQLEQWQRLVDPIFREKATNRSCATIGHCNKFYPFTRGQLKHHDPELLQELTGLWREIALWEDPFCSVRTKAKLERPCSWVSPGALFRESC